jgi:hypothetical protein
MKRVTLFLVAVMFCASILGQEGKNDVILKLNGDELTGKVVRITDTEIEFSYAGENLTYGLKKADIMKITFASGRIEVYNKPNLPSQATGPSGSAQTSNRSTVVASLEDHHNKVAILPFSFIRDGQPTADALAEQVQNECFSMLNKHAGVYTIMNPRTSNALLAKAGVNDQTIKSYTMDDLCNILGVEYVVDCMVSVNKTTQTVTQSNSGQVKEKNQKDTRFNTYSYGTSKQNYKTSLDLGMYNDKGQSVYSQQRSSFWATQDAYKSTLEYLLKRSPLYTK